MHHLAHHPLRPASAEPATVTVAAAYEGAVMTTNCSKNALTCSDEGVRFGAYNGRVMTTPSTASTARTATSAVSR